MERAIRPEHAAATPHPLAFSSYLVAKKTVDDRALNQHVVSALRRELAHGRDTRVLEVGAGIGTMLTRLLDWAVLTRGEYTLLDVDWGLLEEARLWLCGWAASTGRTVKRFPGSLHIEGGSPFVDMTAHFMGSDLDEFLETRRDFQPVDLLVASAVLDLVDVPTTLPPLLQLLAPDGLYWFSVNFDGETLFQPEHAADTPLIDAYHRSMDQRIRAGRPAGDSKTGRHLFQHLTAARASILASGSSDWVVHAVDGTYPAKEAAFLQFILHSIDAELSWRDEVDQELLREWLRTRRRQLERGALVYIAHQLDFLGKRAEHT